MHVFISYAKKDTQALARELKRRIDAQAGMSAWMDEGLHTGSLWSTQIEQELEKCDVFLVLISPDVNREKTKEQDISFVRREIEQAKEDHKRIMVVLAQPAKIPLVLKGEQYIDLTRNHQADIEKIIAELRHFQVSTSSGQIPILNEEVWKKISDSMLEKSQPEPDLQPPPIDWSGIFSLLGYGLGLLLVLGLCYGLYTLVAPASEVEKKIKEARTPLTQNSDWTPFAQTFDGVEMMLIPSGCFMMGAAGEAHRVCIDEPFWLDKYEVSQAQFSTNKGEKTQANTFTGVSLPVQNITWFEAKTYCERRRKGRLPSEAEWEFAARGPNNLLYPWGTEFVAENAVYAGNSGDTVGLVGTARGLSWTGVSDFSGNVWEWTTSRYLPYPYVASDGREDVSMASAERVVRGGSWLNEADEIMPSARTWFQPTTRLDNLGLRCARSVD